MCCADPSISTPILAWRHEAKDEMESRFHHAKTVGLDQAKLMARMPLCQEMEQATHAEVRPYLLVVPVTF